MSVIKFHLDQTFVTDFEESLTDTVVLTLHPCNGNRKMATNESFILMRAIVSQEYKALLHVSAYPLGFHVFPMNFLLIILLEV